ncbi:MAG: type II secretion system protein [Candidatus Paceibacterota bacterium]|jgi:prepilin-type N-terminal cleavage/methylation domain-containing protein
MLKLKIEKPKSENNRGFTLIELLLVLAIVGILSGMVLSNLRLSQSQTRDILRLSDIQTITTGLKIYYDANGSYPKTIRELVPTQLSALPLDPKSSSSTPINYAYTALGSATNCNGYHLGATLENKNNDALRKDEDAKPSESVCSSSTKDFSGSDSAGCPVSLNGACFDIKKLEMKQGSSTISSSSKR